MRRIFSDVSVTSLPKLSVAVSKTKDSLYIGGVSPISSDGYTGQVTASVMEKGAKRSQVAFASFEPGVLVTAKDVAFKLQDSLRRDVDVNTQVNQIAGQCTPTLQDDMYEVILDPLQDQK